MSISMHTTTVGFIGIGIMGKSMAGHLLRAGYPLGVYNRTKAKAQELLDGGALWHDDIASLAQASDVIITIVGYPADVEQVYFGESGILTNARTGAITVDMTTSTPSLARRISVAAHEKGIEALDAPVTGGDVGAREAKLSIMVGGESTAFEAVRPILDKIGSTVVFQGEAGRGQHAKMANQIAIAGAIMGLCESIAYAEKVGLDPQTLLKSIENGSAGSRQMSMLGPRIIAGNFAPGFYVKHFLKDLTIALDVAREMKLDLPMLSLARQLYERLIARGGADLGTHALFTLYRA